MTFFNVFLSLHHKEFARPVIRLLPRKIYFCTMVRLHRNLVEAVFSVIRAVWEERAHADKAIENMLKSNPRWGARDRAFIAETSYEIIRYYRLLAHMAGESSDYWKIIAAYFVSRKIPLPVWDHFAGIPVEIYQNRWFEAKEDLGICESYPEEWIAWMRQDFPDTYADELKALNEPAKLVLRTNLLKTNKDRLLNEFKKHGHNCHALTDVPDALVADQKWNVFQDPLFTAGYFEIQDASSQRVAEFMELKPGMRVIDACAGAGGKSLHIAAKLMNQGRIIAMDVEAWKLDNLKKRARRAGAHCIETRLIENNKTIKRQAETCDRLLLDVPCSGTGVIRRNPDAKWKVDQQYVDRMVQLQQKILQQYSKMVKPGGKLIYSTCSILSLENSKQIAYFCAGHPDFRLEKDLLIRPCASGFDGFYMARLVKT